MIISDMDACHGQRVTITQHLLCRTPSSPVRQELSLPLEEQDFLKGNLGHVHMAWLRKRRRGRGAHKVPYEQKRGGVAGHPQREAKAVWKGREGAGGWCLFLTQTHHCSSRCIA